MKKAIILFLFVLSISTIHAQTQFETQVNQLEQKVDSLEHELAYLKLSSTLKSLNTDLTLFSNELSIKILEIQANSYNGFLSTSMSKAYKEYYRAVVAKNNSYKEYLQTIKAFFASRILTFPYTQMELETLFSDYNVIEKGYDSVEKAMNLLKVTIDAHSKYN